jgi:hypothetical protein
MLTDTVRLLCLLEEAVGSSKSDGLGRRYRGPDGRERSRTFARRFDADRDGSWESVDAQKGWERFESVGH